MESEYLIKRRQIMQGVREKDPKKVPQPIAKVSAKRKEQMKEDKIVSAMDKEFYAEIWLAIGARLSVWVQKRAWKRGAYDHVPPSFAEIQIP